MTHDDARMFAEDWCQAWNDLAVERVLGYFDDHVAFTSPTALAVTGARTVHGKHALREYWNTALDRAKWLRFRVDRVVWDPVCHELAIIYHAEVGDKKRHVSENLTFGSNGLVVSAEVFHGAEL